MKIEIAYFVDPTAKVLVGTNDEIGLTTEAPTLDELRRKVSAAAADLLDTDTNSLEFSFRPVVKCGRYPFASPEDEANWREQKQFFDDLYDEPHGDFSQTDMK